MQANIAGREAQNEELILANQLLQQKVDGAADEAAELERLRFEMATALIDAKVENFALEVGANETSQLTKQVSDLTQERSFLQDSISILETENESLREALIKTNDELNRLSQQGIDVGSLIRFILPFLLGF